MLNLKEYKDKPTSLADYLPWAALVAPGVILNKDGSFMSIAKFRGPDLESASAAEQAVLAARINALIKPLGAGWVIYVEAKRQACRAYPVSDFPDPVSELIDRERRARFEEIDTHFETLSYLTLQYLPPAETTAKAESLLFERSGSAGETSYKDHLKRFSDSAEKLFSTMSSFMSGCDMLEDSALLTYLHSTISSKSHWIAVPETPMHLDSFLVDTPLTCGLQPMLGDDYLGVVGIIGLPDMTRPDQLHALLDLPFSYRWSVRFLPLDKPQAERLLNKYRRQWFAKRKGLLSILKETLSGEASALVDTDADNKAADVTGALEELGADLVSYGYLTMSIVVCDAQENILKDKCRAVERAFNAQGIATVSESLNAVEAWLGTIPGQAYANVRMPLINSLNLAHLLPLSAPWAGPQKNEHLDGPPLLIANTASTTPFRLVTQVGDVGHTLVIGPTGAGKSVLLSLIAMQFRRYPEAQVFLFDKGGSSHASFLAMGGQYISASSEDGYQPLADIDRASRCGWARDWLLSLLAGEGVTITPDIKDSIWQALKSLASAPREQRTLTGLTMLLADSELSQAFAPFTLEGTYGALLDASEDTLTFSSLQAFEMEELMERTGAVAPVLSYLFERLEERFDGRPTLVILDEAWLYLDHPLFAGKLKDWLKTLRKKNVSVIFATQSLADIAASPIAHSLIESCPTRIFLPNERAFEPNMQSLYTSFGLRDQQLELIAGATPKRDYYLMSSKGCRLFDLDIGPLALSLLSATTPEAHRQINELLKQYGPEDFAHRFFRAHGFDWAADLIAELSHPSSSSP